ncbi:hypothetical protein EVAR_4518_1 [Eumeta japonica]|uniref:Uncharacterized protein n=1 Tax=Eumeta variegata TaxID=151549 RepID=A0A4C1SVZ2_EUMVA|nr:hypothetical protein EVAR_4518_1 [Eumeta japonica]
MGGRGLMVGGEEQKLQHENDPAPPVSHYSHTGYRREATAFAVALHPHRASTPTSRCPYFRPSAAKTQTAKLNAGAPDGGDVTLNGRANYLSNEPRPARKKWAHYKNILLHEWSLISTECDHGSALLFVLRIKPIVPCLREHVKPSASDIFISSLVTTVAATPKYYSAGVHDLRSEAFHIRPSFLIGVNWKECGSTLKKNLQRRRTTRTRLTPLLIDRAYQKRNDINAKGALLTKRKRHIPTFDLLLACVQAAACSSVTYLPAWSVERGRETIGRLSNWNGQSAGGR